MPSFTPPPSQQPSAGSPSRPGSPVPARRLPMVGLAVAAALMALAMAIPALLDWDVHVTTFPPLKADWDPRAGYSTPAAVLLAVAGVAYAPRLARTLTWRRLLVVVFLAGIAWMLALALVDGTAGVGHVLETEYEYLAPARSITDLGSYLHHYVEHIPYGPHHLRVHVAGHPAGALLFFVVLVRVGLGSTLAVGLVVTALAASTAVAVLVTLRALGAEATARRAAPFLVLGPAAIWQCVSADAMFAACGAWGVAALAVAAVRRSRTWSVAAGLLLGYAVMLSYGLVLLGVLAVATLLAARSFSPLVVAALTALAVVLAFALAGFAWWEAYPAVADRYWAGVAHNRPAAYWTWADLAALLFSAGPLLGAGVAVLAGRWRELRAGTRTRVAVLLSGAAVTMVLLADLSQMSRAEVERIWLPFVPWLLVSCAFLPRRWRYPGLAVQVLTALLVQHLLHPDW